MCLPAKEWLAYGSRVFDPSIFRAWYASALPAAKSTLTWDCHSVRWWVRLSVAQDV